MYSNNAINPTLHTAAIAALETLINKALLLDLSTKNRLGSLENHVFLLHCVDPELRLYVIPGNGDVRLCGFFEGEANTSLTGNFGEFLKLAKADDPANALINGNLELDGDSHALMTLQGIVKNLELDWELPLSKLFGDVVGHQLGRGLRHSFRFGSQAIKRIRRQLDDFLVEESGLIAPNWQIEKFFRDVEQLSLRTERVEAKLKKYRLTQASLQHD